MSFSAMMMLLIAQSKRTSPGKSAPEKSIPLFERVYKGIDRFICWQTASKMVRSFFGPAGCCRFTITCRRYAQLQWQTTSKPRALWNIVRRICACHPWGPTE